MFNFLKFIFPKKILGIDIGTASIKIVELYGFGKKKKLENYGELESSFIEKKDLLQNKANSNSFSNESIAKAIRAILDEARIKTKRVVLSIPDFSTFYTTFELPPMTPEELPGAITYNASQYITLPSSEVTLDWQVISDWPTDEKSPIKIFLVALPNQLIQDYKTIAKLAGLELYAIEAEVFAITRALIKNNSKTVCLIDMGAQSSTINIVDKGFLKRSYSFNFNSNQLSRFLSESLKVDYAAAEEIKIKEGLLSSKKEVIDVLSNSFNPLLAEIKNVSNEFFQKEQKEVQEIYLTGGTANLPGLREYFTKILNKKVSVPDCFSDFLYPVAIKQTIQEIGPSFSAAVGAALYGLEH